VAGRRPPPARHHRNRALPGLSVGGTPQKVNAHQPSLGDNWSDMAVSPNRRNRTLPNRWLKGHGVGRRRQRRCSRTRKLSSSVHRYYDPSTGQFLSVDPMVATTEQSYVYVSSDPVNLVDPLGECGITTNSVGGFFGSLGTDLNPVSKTNCAYAPVHAAQKAFTNGYHQLTPGWQSVDRDVILGISAAVGALLGVDQLGSCVLAAGQAVSGPLSDTLLTPEFAQLAFNIGAGGISAHLLETILTRVAHDPAVSATSRHLAAAEITALRLGEPAHDAAEVVNWLFG
jgi:RHS repeat-associated protein